ncbi:MAG: TlyA family rRNA (cytidine-2'-O)-methyltransferase, partial [Hoeflea sp.]
GAVVSDVSFISLRLALPPALALAAPGAFAVLLVKPQFEAGRTAIGKGGLLKDPSLGPVIARELAAWLGTIEGWRATGPIASPIAGGDGNQEFLIGGLKS